MTAIRRIPIWVALTLVLGGMLSFASLAVVFERTADSLQAQNDRQDAALEGQQAKADKLDNAIERQQTALLRANRRLEAVGEDPVAVPAVPGPQGEQGLPGLPGESGATGAPGPRGSVGPTGAPGASVVGPKGDPGQQGEQGRQGPQGDRGQDGQSAFPFSFSFTAALTTYHVSCSAPGDCTVTETPAGASRG